MNDYRNSPSCRKLENLNLKKVSFLESFSQKKDCDTYHLIQRNPLALKEFHKLYNQKCAYCGVSSEIVSSTNLEIDHFINKKSPLFQNEAEAHRIQNLVLSCRTCNRNKGAFKLNHSDKQYLHPDSEKLHKVFYRDSDFYIQITKEFLNIKKVREFHRTLKLGSELKRIDYLLLKLFSLSKNCRNLDIHLSIDSLALKLVKKRNVDFKKL